MKHAFWWWILFSLLSTACSTPSRIEPDPTQMVDYIQPAVENERENQLTGPTGVPETGPTAETSQEEPYPPPDVPQGSACIDGTHPIGASIADQYPDITTYEEVMSWFCDGAEFEDILNALMTEEITEVAAKFLLEQVAAGATWDAIWYELGIAD